MSKDKKNILLIGPLPKPPKRVGGPMISFSNLSEYFQNETGERVRIIDTARSGNLFSYDLLAGLRVYILCLLNYTWADVVMINMSGRGGGTFGYHLAKLFKKKKVIIRFFGTTIDMLSRAEKFNNKLAYLFKHATILLQTKGLVEDFSKRFPVSKIYWLPTTRTTENQLSEDNLNVTKTFRCLYVGHIKKEKGIFTILEASKRLIKNNANVSIDLYGDLREGITIPDVENDIVSYRGHIRPGETIQIMQKYDVLIFPTFHPGEGYPGVIIEAFFSGLPVITTNWKYIPEIISDDVNGYLIEVGDHDRLSNVIESLMNDETKLLELKKNAKRNSENYDSNNWNYKILNLIEDEANN
jgi:glycosyltransferase involved in cell wall biosynthesis